MTNDSPLRALLSRGEAGLGPELVENLPLPWRFRRGGGDSYDLDDDALVAAAQSALLLGQPLVLAGEPGVGKTSFAEAFADRLELEIMPPVRVKSSTAGPDLFYSFDEVARFRDASQTGAGQGALRDYVRFSSLGRAILWSAGPDAVVAARGVPAAEILGDPATDAERMRLGDLFPAEFRAPVYTADGLPGFRDVDAPERSIVLVDELDKAPRDAPNDILGEIESMSFTIAELDLTIAADPTTWPLLLITSNSERSFPDAFLRRCVFHWIEFPDETRVARIAAARCAEMGAISPNDPLVRSAVEFFMRLRRLAENKKPATAELISFLSTLLEMGYKPSEEMRTDDPRVNRALGVLLKTQIDLDAALREFAREMQGGDG